MTYDLVAYDEPRSFTVESRQKSFISRDTVTVAPARRGLHAFTTTRCWSSAAAAGPSTRSCSCSSTAPARRPQRACAPRSTRERGARRRRGARGERRRELHARRLRGQTPACTTGRRSRSCASTARRRSSPARRRGSAARLRGCLPGRAPGSASSAAMRSERRRAAAQLSAAESDVADLSSLAATRAFADRFAAEHDRLDILVLNAGALTHDFTLTGEGYEVTLATHVLSPVPADPPPPAAARGRALGPRDLRRLGRHVPRAARCRRAAAGGGELRRRQGLRAGEARSGRAGRGVDARARGHRTSR